MYYNCKDKMLDVDRQCVDNHIMRLEEIVFEIGKKYYKQTME